VTERESNGHWKKGHSGNPKGRPRKSVEEKYLSALRDAVTMDDLQKMFAVGLSRAKAGDLGWAKLIAEYLIGKPTQYVDAALQAGGTVRLELFYVQDWRNANTDAND
jgi:hypothetical protein